MAGYMGSEAYDFNNIDVNEALDYFASAAEPIPHNHKRKEPVKTTVIGVETSVERNAKSLPVSTLVKQTAVFLAVSLVLYFSVMYLRSSCNALEYEIAKAQIDIAEQQSETIRLTSELNAMISTEAIDEYAAKNGMIKAESNQITYIDLSEGDKVVVSGGKSVDEANTALQKIKDFFAYIF